MFSLWEIISPLRKIKSEKKYRWFDNLLLIFLGNFSLRLLFPLGLAFFVRSEGEDSFYHLVFSILLLDLLIYIQHVLSHKVDFLWRFHKIHHSDLDMDVTTALRFHPIEIVLSFFYKAFFIYVFCISIEAIFLFEIILSSMALFNHSNIKLPKKLDRFFQYVFVTPVFHTVHHSQVSAQMNSNYGFNLSIWDRIFKTYKEVHYKAIHIGLIEFSQNGQLLILKLLKFPFERGQKR